MGTILLVILLIVMLQISFNRMRGYKPFWPFTEWPSEDHKYSILGFFREDVRQNKKYMWVLMFAVSVIALLFITYLFIINIF